MKSPYKPEGYITVSPYLIVNDVDATISFLAEVFSAIELRRVSNDKGNIHAEVRIDDTVVMLGAGSANDWLPMPAHVYIYVSDVDAIYQRAIAASAISVQEPIKKEDEDKRGGVKDAGGTTWWIATKME